MRDGAPAFFFTQGLDRTRRRQRMSAVPPHPGPDGQMVDGGASKSELPFLSRAGIDVDTLGEDTELSALTDGPCVGLCLELEAVRQKLGAGKHILLLWFAPLVPQEMTLQFQLQQLALSATPRFAVYVSNTEKSYLLVVANGSVLLVDSHQHGQHGALVASGSIAWIAQLFTQQGLAAYGTISVIDFD